MMLLQRFPDHIIHRGRVHRLDVVAGTGEPIYKHVTEKGETTNVIVIYPDHARAAEQRRRKPRS